MARKKVLISVTTYPLPSRSYDELVCTAGLLENGEWMKCLKVAEGNEAETLAKVREKYEQEFLIEKDIYLFLGTTKEWHMRRAKNPFVIIGVFYPKIETQMKLF